MSRSPSTNKNRRTAGDAFLPEADRLELVETYRRWMQFDRARAPAGVRGELRKISRQMRDAADRLLEITTGGVDLANHSASRAAWLMINDEANLRRSASPLHTGANFASALRTFSHLALSAAEKVPKTRYRQSAAPMLADAVCGDKWGRGSSAGRPRAWDLLQQFFPRAAPQPNKQG